MGEAVQPYVLKAGRPGCQLHQRQVAQLAEPQLVVLRRQQRADVRQRGCGGRVFGMHRIDAAEVDVGDDAQHQVVHLVERIPLERQVAPPAEVVEHCAADRRCQLFRCVFIHSALLS